MTLFRLLFYYLWIAPHILLIAVAVLMIRRKVFKEFPAFLVYSIFEFVQFSVLFALIHLPSVSGQRYYDAYLVGVAVSAALRFGVIHEIFENVFRNYTALDQLRKVLFGWATVVLLLVAVATATFAPGENSRLIAAIYAIGRAVSIVQAGLIFFLFLFTRYFALTWRNYVFGIALGLGIFASVDLATSAIKTQLGPNPVADVLNMVSMATYHCSVLIWLFYLLAPEHETRRINQLPSHDLQQWNNELQRLL
jgi:hypothetical protein